MIDSPSNHFTIGLKALAKPSAVKKTMVSVVARYYGDCQMTPHYERAGLGNDLEYIISLSSTEKT